MKNIIYLFALLLTTGVSIAQDLDTVWTKPNENFRCVKFSPDGRKIYVSSNNTIVEIEASTGNILNKFDSVNFSLGPVYMEITKDGKYVLTSGASYNIFAWDTETGKSLGAVDYKNQLNGKHNFTIHPIEHQIYFGSNDTLIIYDLDSNLIIFKSIIPGSNIVKIKASKDNKYLAVCSEYYNQSKMIYQKNIFIIDAKSFSVIKEIINNVQDIFSFDFSFDSNYLTYVYYEERGRICGVYNIDTSENKLFAYNSLIIDPIASKFFGFNNLVLVSGYDSSDNFLTSVFDYNKKSILYTVKYGGEIDNLDINNKNEIIISSYGASRCLALINSRWFTTSVPPDPRININGNMKINYMNEVLSLDNADSELIKLISVFDINGKLVKTYDAGYSGATVELPFSAPAGVYLVRIVTDRSDYNFRFVRE